MKWGIPLIVLSLLAMSSYAQDSTKTTTPRTKKIKLSALSQAKEPAIGIKAIRVIPVCDDTSRLGFVQIGMLNKMISAVPDMPWQPWLQDFVTGTWQPLYKNDGKFLLWIVKDLRITERSFAMSEKAFVRLTATAYISGDGNSYKQVAAIDTILVRGGMDVTGKHGRNIAETFELLMKRSANAPLNDSSFTADELVAKAEGRFNHPILNNIAKNERIHNGVYLTFQEFLDDAPAISRFGVNYERDGVRISEHHEDGTKTEIKNAWGICGDGELYKNIEGQLVPLDKSGHSFVLSNYLDAINRKNKSIFWSSIAGGAMGAVIASNSAGNLYLVTTLPYIKKHFPEATAIDMETGELKF